MILNFFGPSVTIGPLARRTWPQTGGSDPAFKTLSSAVHP